MKSVFAIVENCYVAENEGDESHFSGSDTEPVVCIPLGVYGDNLKASKKMLGLNRQHRERGGKGKRYDVKEIVVND